MKATGRGRNFYIPNRAVDFYIVNRNKFLTTNKQFMNLKNVLLKKTSLLLLAIMLTSAATFAATFTSATSGSFSAGATWVGGTAPSPNIGAGDVVIISAGTTVDLDEDVVVTGLLSNFQVNGTLTSTANHSLTAGALGTISGAGTMTTGSLVLMATSTFSFTGNATANTVSNSVLALQLGAHIVATQTLNLTTGVITLASGSGLTLGNNSTIVISGGSLAMNGGTLGLTNNYNVSYTTSSSTSGLELSGSGLNNVTVNVSSGNTVTLSSNLTVGGTLNLTSGTLNLNGNDLIVLPTGNISASGTGTISSTSSSNIGINSTGGLTGTLNFSGNGSSVNNFIVNVGSGNQASIGGNLTIDGQLNIGSGTLNFSNSSLTINGTVTGSGSFSGNSSSNLTINTSGGIGSSLNFASGGQAVNNLTINTGIGSSVALGSALTVNGTLNLNGGSSLNFNNQSLTIGTGGSITGNGSLQANSSSSLIINSTANNASSIDITGGVIGSLTINSGSGNNTTLNSDLTVDGTLSLQSGNLALNGNDLTIGASGNLSAGGSGSITSTSSSNIAINATAGLSGTLSISGSGNSAASFTLNTGSSSTSNISGSLAITGMLNLTSGTLGFSSGTLTVGGGVSGSGSLSGSSSSNLTVNSSVAGGLHFANGGQILNNFSIGGSNSTVVLATGLTVNGNLDVASGSGLDFSNQSLTIGSAGSITGSGSLTANSGSSLVINSTGGTSTGINITGGTIGSLTINNGGSGSSTLNGNLTVTTALNLQSGTLILNNNDLTVSGNLTAGGSGTLTSTAGSNVSIITGSSTSGSLGFAAGGSTVGNFTVGSGNGSVSLSSDLTVTDSLHFISGTINTNNNGLEVATGGTIVGAGSSSYVITGANGHLGLQLTAGAATATTFHVGTSSQYTPTTVQLNSGSASGGVDVGVGANVLANGTTGTDISSSQSVVDATYFVHSDITSNLNLNLGVTWNSALEVNGFNHNAAYISHYTNGSWDASAAVSATAQGNGNFSLVRNNITSLSPFAVFDQNTTTAVAEVSKDVKFELFPNPASTNILVKNVSATTDVLNVDVTNMIGQVVATYRLTDSDLTIPVSNLFDGNYFIRIYNTKINVVKKFTKI
jgi:hypothetical protein